MIGDGFLSMLHFFTPREESAAGNKKESRIMAVGARSVSDGQETKQMLRYWLVDPIQNTDRKIKMRIYTKEMENSDAHYRGDNAQTADNSNATDNSTAADNSNATYNSTATDEEKIRKQAKEIFSFDDYTLAEEITEDIKNGGSYVSAFMNKNILNENKIYRFSVLFDDIEIPFLKRYLFRDETFYPYQSYNPTINYIDYFYLCVQIYVAVSLVVMIYMVLAKKVRAGVDIYNEFWGGLIK
ncbi:hypothetical protein ENBRE01_2248 [Enteropsectra breve]|nr:hypothetical protein ENBRE01_2248 [Enteropsectra breve]